ncbi:MAG: hypothetical protein Q8R60_00715 [Mycobacteriales bacterium]|nr:hypothetical protein [Mycobacteriales bacterium]
MRKGGYDGVRRALLPLLVAGLVAGVGGLGPDARAADATPAPTTTVTVGGCAVNAPVVPADYLGLSIEWSMVQHWFGTSADTAVAATVRLLQELGDDGVLRIGGNSQDDYHWTPDGDPATNQLFSGVVTTGMVDALLEVARRSGWHLVLGLNLKVDQPEKAAALVRYAVLQDIDRRLLAVAPGNEPDAYMPDVTSYLERYGRYVDALDADPLARTVPLTGPDVSNGVDLSWIEALRRAHSSRIGYLGWHDYGNRPSLATLLSPEVQQRFLSRVGLAEDAAALVPQRMSEGNSVGRGGLGRVSDVTGSSAWTIDTILSGAQAGLAGYHLHSWDNHYYRSHPLKARYTPFFVRDGKTLPAPGVYALALVKEIAGKRFCGTTTSDLSAGLAGDLVKAWAATGLTETSHVVYLVNKGTTSAHSGQVAVTLPPGEVTASRINDLAGCSGRTTTINGATLQPDGTLQWERAPLQRAEDGTVSVTVSPCQTVVLHVTDGPELPAPL